MATAPVTTAKSGSAALTCPECGKTFSRPAALGAHRKMTHGVAGTSANATNQRSKKRTPKAAATPATNNGRRTPTRRRRAVASTAETVNRDVLLGALFPSGIPPRQDVIGAVNAWLDEADRLSKLN